MPPPTFIQNTQDVRLLTWWVNPATKAVIFWEPAPIIAWSITSAGFIVKIRPITVDRITREDEDFGLLLPSGRVTQPGYGEHEDITQFQADVLNQIHKAA